jgi:sulfate adenylyltransferase subunit 1 (EFTu-like GTPase family)
LGGGKIIRMDVLKIATAGSVDDGKVIGRLLYDTQSLNRKKVAKQKDMII